MSNRIALLESLERGDLALFIGADLPHEVTGLPSRADMTRELAERKGIDDTLSLAQVAQRVAQGGKRWEFTAFLRDQLDTTGTSPQPFHQRMVNLVRQHQVNYIITTAYDNLLTLAFQEAGVAINRVVRGSDVSFINPDRPTLIKLYGDAQQPDTLVVTEDAHYGLGRDREKEDLLHEVRTVLRRQTVLFLGYNLADPDFNLLWREVLDRAGRFARTAYAVWPGMAADEIQMWRERGIVILEEEPWKLIEEINSPKQSSEQIITKPQQQPKTLNPPTQETEEKGQSFMKKLSTEYKIAILVAIIGAIATIIAPLLDKPDFIVLFGPTPTSQPTQSVTSTITPETNTTNVALNIQEIWPKETSCQLGGTWKAILQIEVIGGDGTYRYYNNGEWVMGPMSDHEVDIPLTGQKGTPIEGTITVESSGMNVSQDYTIPVPDCN